MKVLILKPSSLGDVVQALPVLRMFKRAHPSAEIYWWIAAELAPLLEKDPDLSGIFLFDRREAVNPFFWPELFLHVRQMRTKRFDYVLDLQSLARSGVVAWFANAATTIGLDDSREGATTFYDLAVRRPSWHTHAVDWYLEVLRALDVPINWDFTWLPPRLETQNRVAERFPQAGPRVCLIPGARWDNKRWPLEHFQQLAAKLIQVVPDVQLTVLGGKADLPAGQAIKSVAPHHVQDLTSRTTLPEMVEVLRQSRLAITNDTGPMHIADALGVPVLPLFGPTAPARTGPYRQLKHVMQHSLPCIPCMEPRCRYLEPLACLKRITAQSVAAEALRRLGSSA